MKRARPMVITEKEMCTMAMAANWRRESITESRNVSINPHPS
jgi:hypothetical protein